MAKSKIDTIEFSRLANPRYYLKFLTFEKSLSELNGQKIGRGEADAGHEAASKYHGQAQQGPHEQSQVHPWSETNEESSVVINNWVA